MGSQRADAAEGRSPALVWPIVCWAGVLLLIGIVQVVRAQWFDAAVFFGATALVLVSPWLPGRRAQAVTRRVVTRRVVAVGTAAVGALVCLLPRHTPLMELAVGAVGVAAIAIAWAGPVAGSTPWTRGQQRLGGIWVGMVVLGCAWELVQFIAGRIHPAAASYALSDLLDPLLDTTPGRIGFVVVWLAAGAFLLRREARR